MTIFNFEEKKKLQELGQLILLTFFQLLFLFILFFVPMCLIHSAKFYIPVSIISQSTFMFGFVTLYFKQQGQKEPMKYVYENQKQVVFCLTVLYMVL